jgi:hypothetical protein
MLVVGKTYKRIRFGRHTKNTESHVVISRDNISSAGNIYYIGSDGNHYDKLGRRSPRGVYNPYNPFHRKFDLIVEEARSLEEMLQECLG